MRYYKGENRILFQTKDEDDKVIGFGVKMPKYMKNYPYYKLAFKADGTETILQTEVMVAEAEELTLTEAQDLSDLWADSYEDLDEDVFDENGERTGEIRKVKPKSIKILSCDKNKIKDKMKKLHKGVS